MTDFSNIDYFRYLTDSVQVCIIKVTNSKIEYFDDKNNDETYSKKRI